MAKIAENHESEKSRISQLNDNLNQKNIEINTLKTKNQILNLDLENKIKENDTLNEKINLLKKENAKQSEDLENNKTSLSEKDDEIQKIDQKYKDVKMITE